MDKIYYLVRGELIDSQEAPIIRVGASRQITFGRAYFCPVCTDLWAVCLVDNQETYVEHILCDKHEPRPSRSMPGCLTLPGDEEWNQTLPKKILARDFLIMFNHLHR